VHRRTEVLHAALGVAATRQPLQHLVLADPEVVLLERALKRALGPRVLGEQVAPCVDELGGA
jgi:hypothetical protein